MVTRLPTAPLMHARVAVCTLLRIPHDDSEYMYWARWFEIVEDPRVQAFVDIPI